MTGTAEHILCNKIYNLYDPLYVSIWWTDGQRILCYGGSPHNSVYIYIYALQCINRTKLVLVRRPSASIAHNARALYIVSHRTYTVNLNGIKTRLFRMRVHTEVEWGKHRGHCLVFQRLNNII